MGLDGDQRPERERERARARESEGERARERESSVRQHLQCIRYLFEFTHGSRSLPPPRPPDIDACGSRPWQACSIR